ncbi:hypothetical protein [Mesorhizobium sp. WSM3882]|uniref:hypothetical protein n=1 Tax=Mesorhizobium sp. WSM3882 TaxID=2029407 RepID=UPI000BB07539|nr:hypothetical protein [Mesorhizobium sp. WSM3882]PBB31250.1 hypothetical protein CK214_16275 [Mesorhizobium sp. WSM3882]
MIRFILCIVFAASCAFSSPLFAQEKVVLGSTKSLSIADQGKDEIWKPDEIEQPSTEKGELKDLMPNTAPSIQEKRVTTALGTVVFSQLWDITCTELCPTKVVLEKLDGTKKVLLDDVLPQILPEGQSKSLKVDDQVSISDDLKTLWIDTDQHGVETFELNN